MRKMLLIDYDGFYYFTLFLFGFIVSCSGGSSPSSNSARGDFSAIKTNGQTDLKTKQKS